MGKAAVAAQVVPWVLGVDFLALLAAPLWVAAWGRPVPPFLYLELGDTARRHTPHAIGTKTGSVLACTGSGSVLACTGSLIAQGTPTTRESRRRPLQYSPTSLRQRPSVHR